MLRFAFASLLLTACVDATSEPITESADELAATAATIDASTSGIPRGTAVPWRLQRCADSACRSPRHIMSSPAYEEAEFGGLAACTWYEVSAKRWLTFPDAPLKTGTYYGRKVVKTPCSGGWVTITVAMAKTLSA